MTEPNRDQIRLAGFLGIDIASDTELVAAARIEDFVAPSIHPGSSPFAATEGQIELGDSISVDLRGDSARVASARLTEALFELNKAAAAELDLHPGDRVIQRLKGQVRGRDVVLDREFVVSSVGKNFRVWFKGGNGRSSWPTEIKRAGALNN